MKVIKTNWVVTQYLGHSMGDLHQVPAFSEACFKGHRLFGKVRFCPFCGVAVGQPNAVTGQAEMVVEPPKNRTATPIPQPQFHPENKSMAPESASKTQPPIPQPILTPAHEGEPAQPETMQQPQPSPTLQQATAPSKMELDKPSTRKNKTFPKWGGGLIVLSLVILLVIWMFGGGKTEAPDQRVPEAVTPPAAVQQTPAVPAVIPQTPPPAQPVTPYTAPPAQQVTPYTAPPAQQVTPYTAPPKKQTKPDEDEKVTALIREARKYIAEGNYQGAEDAMKFCGMLDPENRECQRIKQKAGQLNSQMFNCVSAGKEWIDGACH